MVARLDLLPAGIRGRPRVERPVKRTFSRNILNLYVPWLSETGGRVIIVMMGSHSLEGAVSGLDVGEIRVRQNSAAKLDIAAARLRFAKRHQSIRDTTGSGRSSKVLHGEHCCGETITLPCHYRVTIGRRDTHSRL